MTFGQRRPNVSGVSLVVCMKSLFKWGLALALVLVAAPMNAEMLDRGFRITDAKHLSGLALLRLILLARRYKKRPVLRPVLRD
jgi:hypothetical protein